MTRLAIKGCMYCHAGQIATESRSASCLCLHRGHRRILGGDCRLRKLVSEEKR